MGIPILAGEPCRVSFEAKSLDHALVNRAFAELLRSDPADGTRRAFVQCGMVGGSARIYRSLLRRPALFVAIVLTLTLGIGANSAVFSVIDAVLLRPLSYPEGDQLMSVYETSCASRSRKAWWRRWLS
jgi:hypothetical protein